MKIERIFWIIIIISILVMLFKNKQNTDVEYIQGDTVFTTITQTKDSLIPYDTIIYLTDTLVLHDTAYVNVFDTVYVYNDFFKMYSYKIDTNIQEVDLIINEKITQNRLYERQINLKNNRETKLIMTKDNSFGVGAIVGINITAPTISYEFKNHQIGVGYNFNNPSPIFMYQYKFDFK